MAQKRIQDVMTRDLQTVRPETTLSEAANTMREHDIGLLSIASNGDVQGVITDRDIVVRGLGSGKNPDKTPVKDVMTKEPLSTTPDEKVDEAAELMRNKRVRRLLVYDQNKPVGVVSVGDLAIRADSTSTAADVLAACSNREAHA